VTDWRITPAPPNLGELRVLVETRSGQGSWSPWGFVRFENPGDRNEFLNLPLQSQLEQLEVEAGSHIKNLPVDPISDTPPGAHEPGPRVANGVPARPREGRSITGRMISGELRAAIHAAVEVRHGVVPVVRLAGFVGYSQSAVRQALPLMGGICRWREPGWAGRTWLMRAAALDRARKVIARDGPNELAMLCWRAFGCWPTPADCDPLVGLLGVGLDVSGRQVRPTALAEGSTFDGRWIATRS